MLFSAIKSFVNDLGDAFAKDSHSLALYERLLNKTTEQHKDAMEKHMNAFRKFCTDNEQAILTKTGPFTPEPITYSQRVFIDMTEIFKMSTLELQQAIWSHLLTILALVNPSSGALSILKQENANIKEQSLSSKQPLATVGGDGDEDNFLQNIISKVEQHVNPDTSNPQEAIASIMSSGLITDLVGSLNSGISSGKLDLGKMMGSVQKMIGDMSSELGPNSGLDSSNPMSMLTNMMSMMQPPK